MIGYITQTRDNRWKACTKDVFDGLTRSDRVKEIIGDVRRGNTGRKRELPAFIFMGELDEKRYQQHVEECRRTGEKPRGSRSEQFLKPTGFFMMDFDRTEGNPYTLYEKFMRVMREQGIDLDKFLVLAHKTAKGHGLRLVCVRRAGSTIEADQRWVSELMQEPMDEVCKDLSRLSYVPCYEDIYFVDYGKLYGSPSPNLPPLNSPVCRGRTTPIGRGLPENTESNKSPLPMGEGSGERLVQALEEQLGGAPKHGSRNNFIFAMACHLRHIFGNDPATLGAIIPTYGERRERWISTIKSACNTPKSDQMPDVLRRAIKVAEYRGKEAEKYGANDKSAEEPALPDRLPPLIAHLTSKVPALYKPAVAMAVFPSLGAHLGGVKFRYLDNVEHEATFMNVLMARMSAGKSCVNKPIDFILADIKKRDAKYRELEQQWKNDTNTKGANKQKPQRPEIKIQVLVSDMTNAAFVQRLQDADGEFLYTCMDEIELLDQLKTTSRSQQVSQIIRLAFDCGEYGQERVGSQSVTAKVRVKWNWNASTTVKKGQEYFRRGLTDGTLSRLSFCTIRTEKGADLPVIGIYDQAFAEVLKPYIDHLNEAEGEVTCQQALDFTRALLKETADYVSMVDDETYEVLSYRAVVMAYLRAMTLYVAHGSEWSEEIEDFVRWSLRYDLWCKMMFFGEQMNKEMQTEDNFKRRPGPMNLLELLPETFTDKDVSAVRSAQGKSPDPRQMICNWLKRRLACKTDVTGQYKRMI